MTRSIDPIVSTDWLQTQLASKEVKIIDIRWAEEYEAGHIPGAISVPFGIQSVWAESGGDFLLELPPDDDLFKLIGDCGLTADSKVVIVGRLEEPPAPRYALADPARVAATLMYAGVRNVAVLSGGHPKWEGEGRPTTTEVPAITPVAYNSAVDRNSWVSTEYVKDHIGKAVIIDGRDPDQYFGASIDPFADMRGHVSTARSLPMTWVWEKDGTYRPADLIGGMSAGVIGDDKDQEIITYCGVGGYASTWWFLLTQLLGYTNVKIYERLDGGLGGRGNSLVQYSWTR